MAARKFKLPGIQDLSKEQEQARALPLTGQQLIIGGPGTGKSVLTLLRARRLEAEKQDYRFLVYNHLLDRSNVQLFGGALASKTWHNWFDATYLSITGRSPARLPQQANGFRPHDWKRIKEVAEACNVTRGPDRFLLVIDEGQDMPQEFYDTLVALGFEDFFVAADQNQQITASRSSRQHIEEALGLETDEVVELRQNYRNSFSIWKLAMAFYTGDLASPPSEAPKRREGGVPNLITYAPDQFPVLVRGIIRRAYNHPSRLIGVIAPNNKVRKRYMEELQVAKRSTGMEEDDLQLVTFYNTYRPEIRFDRGGILVINAQACKGLEFDEVVCADIDEHYINPEDINATRKLFYVMVARAREAVFMLRQEGGAEAINQILPEDRAVLKRGPLRTKAK